MGYTKEYRRRRYNCILPEIEHVKGLRPGEGVALRYKTRAKAHSVRNRLYDWLNHLTTSDEHGNSAEALGVTTGDISMSVRKDAEEWQVVVVKHHRLLGIKKIEKGEEDGETDRE